ncbi:hypothetical protein BGX34_008689 [Mortierella sp. NVP85]|nr:hypothetical protein BGX34_008689 [Mortierella sp. NVP85]
MDNAWKTKDNKLALALCEDAESALSHVRRSAKWAPKYSHNENLRTDIAAACHRLSELQGHLKLLDKAQASYKKAENWGTLKTVDAIPSGTLLIPSIQPMADDSSTISIIDNNTRSPTRKFKLPDPFGCLEDTPQLAYCLGLLKTTQIPETLEQDAFKWLQATKGTNEQLRLKQLAKDVIREFVRDELKDAKVVAEVIYLAPVLDKEDFRNLMRQFFIVIEHSEMLDFHQLEGLARVIQSASPEYLDTDDLVKVLSLLNTHLKKTHRQSSDHMFKLTLAVSNVLDAMADTKVKDLDRLTLHEPLKTYLDKLQDDTDPYMVYQAAYAFQALQYVPDNEPLWQATLRRGGKVLQGIAGVASAAMVFDPSKFIDGLGNIQEGVAGVSGVIKLAKDAYEGVESLYKSGKDFFDCLNEGLSFTLKKAWYPALRGIDILIQEGQFDMIKEIIQKIQDLPCRSDPAFQWGVCQRLGEIAANSKWNPDTRQGAIELLAEIYREDEKWGQHVSIKQWIVKILIQLPESIVDGTSRSKKIKTDKY